MRYGPKDEIVITSGASEAFDIALRALLDPGDEVLCADPSYVAYLPATVMAGGCFVPVPTYAANDFRLIAGDVEAAITPRTKAILLGYPSNPTGAVMGREDLVAIGEVAAQARPGRHQRRTLRPHDVCREAHLLRVAARHAGPHGAARRVQQGVRDDGLAAGLGGRAAARWRKR